MFWTCVDLGPQLTEETFDRLVFKSCPKATRRLGLGMMAIAAICFLINGKNRLTCHRPTLYTANCELTRLVGMGLFPAETVELESVSGAQIVSTMQKSEDGDYLIYDVRINGAYTTTQLGLSRNVSDRRSRRIVDDIQRFLVNPARSSLTVETPYPWVAAVFIAGLVAGSVPLLLRTPARFEFDRAAGRATFWQANRAFSSELSLREVEAIAIEYAKDEDHNEGYRIVLLTERGDRYPLTETFSSGLASKQSAAESIRAFLKLPPVQMPAA